MTNIEISTKLKQYYYNSELDRT